MREKVQNKSITVRVAITLLLIISLVWPVINGAGSVASAADGTITYGGRATVIKGTLAGAEVGPLADTQNVDPEGGRRDAEIGAYPNSGLVDPTGGALNAHAFHATATGNSNISRSQAAVANFGLSVAGQTISAGSVNAEAIAKYVDGSGAAYSGRAQVAELSINGTPVAITGEVNQTITVGLVTVIINEQVASASSGSSNFTNQDRSDITVNGLRIKIAAGTDPLT